MSEDYGNEKECAISEIKEVLHQKIKETEGEISNLTKKYEKLQIFLETDDDFERLISSGFLKDEDFDLVAKDRIFGTLQQKIEKTKAFLDDLKNYIERLEEKY